MHLAVTSIGTSIGVGFTKWTVLGVMSIMGPWLLAHWEEYHSGIMLYGNGYWGVTEANYLMVLLHFFTAAVGPGGHLPWPVHPVVFSGLLCLCSDIMHANATAAREL